MIERRLTIDGREWKISVAGRVTVYEHDEFPLVFECVGAPGARERRLARF